MTKFEASWDRPKGDSMNVTNDGETISVTAMPPPRMDRHPTISDGEFCHRLKEAQGTADRLGLIRQAVMAKFGALAAMASVALEDSSDLRIETLVMLSAARDAAVDRLIPLGGTDGKA